MKISRLERKNIEEYKRTFEQYFIGEKIDIAEKTQMEINDEIIRRIVGIYTQIKNSNMKELEIEEIKLNEKVNRIIDFDASKYSIVIISAIITIYLANPLKSQSSYLSLILVALFIISLIAITGDMNTIKYPKRQKSFYSMCLDILHKVKEDKI